MRQQTKYIFTWLMSMISIYGSLRAQTASETQGCAPLEINFTGRFNSTNYWEFGDGSQSNENNPIHTFASPGTYTVVLRDRKGGIQTGEFKITVFNTPIITVTSDKINGCAPLLINFNSSIKLDTQIKINRYAWVFGDGNVSNLQNPSNVYSNAGIFSVSLKIETNYPKCDVTKLLTDYIKAEGIAASFDVDKLSDCSFPSEFTFTNNTVDASGQTYQWNFGNNTSKTTYDGGKVTYNTPGAYVVELKAFSPNRCTSTVKKTLIVGPPKINLVKKDTYCLRELFTLVNATQAFSFRWTFDGSANPTNSLAKSPDVKYASSGLKTIRLRALAQDTSCYSDTTFNVFIEDADSSFFLTPDPACFTDIQLKFQANNRSYKTYEWNKKVTSSPDFDFHYLAPKRDSLYRHINDTIFTSLIVESFAGCRDTGELITIARRPNAVLIPSHSRGCAPFEVIWTDSSESVEKIVKYTILYGDGKTAIFTTNNFTKYTYNDPGEYYVKYIIENDKGCIDTSEGFWIYVGTKLSPDYSIDKTEICLGESVQIIKTNKDKRIDSWHIDSDNGRFSHCWKSDTATHTFITEPGEFEIKAIVEYNGCMSEAIDKKIKVMGAKANIGFMINCASPYDVMFMNKSIGGTQFTWDFGDTTTSTLDSLVHHYNRRGDFKVKLTAVDPNSGCPASIDSEEVFVREIIASFTIKDKICDQVNYELNASKSQDVDSSCNKGFLFFPPNNRPREVGTSSIMEAFIKPGPDSIRLVVEDINGCKDTTVRYIQVYSQTPAFTMDKTTICYPGTIKFTNNSTADTTIVKYTWSFGATSRDASHTFMDRNEGVDVSLTIEDALGCQDIITKTFKVYKPESRIIALGPVNICKDELISFTAPDFTAQKSFLHFDWDFGPFGKQNTQNAKVTFDKAGDFVVKLKYTEDTSGCMDQDFINVKVVEHPVAKFTSPSDSISIICKPQIEFFNQSVEDGPVGYTWLMNDRVVSTIKEPILNLEENRINKATLIVYSPYGCADTLSKFYRYSPLKGELIVDKTSICDGEIVTFSFKDTLNVLSYYFDYGDGTRSIDNAPVPIQHKYGNLTGSQEVRLFLFSNNNACDTFRSITLKLSAPIADFTQVLDTVDYCSGKFMLKNTSIYSDFRKADVISWTVDGKTYGALDSINDIVRNKDSVLVRLIAGTSICKDTLEDYIQLQKADEFIKFTNAFSPNGDMENDYFIPAIKKEYKDYVKINTFKIFNRWGELVYDNNNPLGWDGKYKGEDAPIEVYMYFIELEILNCDKRSQKGSVTILR